MHQKATYKRIAQLIVVLLGALTLKQYYSTASPNQLRWILAPTTALVELVSGKSFQFESHAGYITSDRRFLIAASCAGVNFLITSFLMLSLGKLWRNRSQNRTQNQTPNSSQNPSYDQTFSLSWRFIPSAFMFAYIATLVANTVRISTALRLQQMPPEISWLSPSQLHRFEGIFIYFGFLLLLFMVSERGGEKSSRRMGPALSSAATAYGLAMSAAATPSAALPPSVMSAAATSSAAGPCGLAMSATATSSAAGPPSVRKGSAFPLSLPYISRGYASKGNIPALRGASSLLRQSLFPLAIYYAITLGIPLANGAYRQGAEFWEHSLFVLLTPLLFVLLSPFLVLLPLATLRLTSKLKLRQFAGREGGLAPALVSTTCVSGWAHKICRAAARPLKAPD